MKKVILFGFFLMLSIIVTFAQEDETFHTEAAEDFDLNAVMDVMKDAEDIADFEKKINSEESQVNNLDLNKDGDVDMIKVIEKADGDTRLFILQAVLGEKESQDIATIEIEKHSDGEISLQVIGDPDIYGKDYIVEPAADDSGDTKKYIVQPLYDDYYIEKKEYDSYAPTVAVFVSVRLWRPISPLFVIGAVVFVSHVGWGAIPVWFVARRVIIRSTWRRRARHYSRHRYHRSSARHSARGRNMYSNNRTRSNVARNNAGPSTNNRNNANNNNRASTNNRTSTNNNKANNNNRTNNNSRANTNNKSNTNNRNSSTNRSSNTRQKSSSQNRSRSRSTGGGGMRGRR